MPKEIYPYIKRSYRELESTFPERVKSLVNPSAKDQLGKVLEKSGGIANVIVHPFFPIWDGDGELPEPDREDEYVAYLDNLQKTVKDADVPIVLYEHEPELENIATTLEALGKPTGDVFLVPTIPADPTPIYEEMEVMNDILKGRGLNAAIVSGSYFEKFRITDYTDDRYPLIKEVPQIAKEYGFDGCVGYTIETYLEAGIVAKPGDATYAHGFLKRYSGVPFIYD
jgi:hypothetical protein